MSGSVGDEHFARLTEGQHPFTQAQMVKRQVSRTYEGKDGKEVTSMEHRAGWDATFSAPKSVSLTALVGGDECVRMAHRESFRVALGELEHHTQARIGNVHAPETTGKFAVATFEHDTARPVEGYAAPQLHTDSVIFNVTERDNGQTRSLQPRELYASQHFVTAIYRAELAIRLQQLGYEIERGKYGQPEIKGYTREYLEASSFRRDQIKKRDAGSHRLWLQADALHKEALQQVVHDVGAHCALCGACHYAALRYCSYPTTSQRRTRYLTMTSSQSGQ